MPAEAREAMEHVAEAERRREAGGPTRLDRNRVRRRQLPVPDAVQDGTKKLTFAIVGPSELELVNKLLYASYHPYEPLTKHLGLCTGLNSLKDVDRMVEAKLAKNLTL